MRTKRRVRWLFVFRLEIKDLVVRSALHCVRSPSDARRDADEKLYSFFFFFGCCLPRRREEQKPKSKKVWKWNVHFIFECRMCYLASCKWNYRNEFLLLFEAILFFSRLWSHIFFLHFLALCAYLSDSIKDADLFSSFSIQNYNHLFCVLLLVLFFVSFNSIICVSIVPFCPKKYIYIFILFLNKKSTKRKCIEFQEWNCFSNDLPHDELNTNLPTANNNLRVLVCWCWHCWRPLNQCHKKIWKIWNIEMALNAQRVFMVTTPN